MSIIFETNVLYILIKKRYIIPQTVHQQTYKKIADWNWQIRIIWDQVQLTTAEVHLEVR